MKTRRILVVDDAQNAREALRTLLEEEGHELAQAVDGEEGLKQIESFVPDVVLADVRMPKMDGLTLLRTARERGYGASFVMMTAFGSVETAVAAMQGGAENFLVKPLDVTTVLVVLDKVFEKRQLEANLNEETKFREKLLGIVGHDLQNPLNAIRMSAEALRKKGGGEVQAKIVNRILSSTKRMGAIIADLLDLTRIQFAGGLVMNRKHMDLRDLCRQLIEELQPANPERVFILDATGELRGTWDSERLAQAISNLVGNALKHGDSHQPVRITARDLGSEVAIEVANHGPAICPDFLPHIFEPFRRGDLKKGSSALDQRGLGLGLYIVQQIVLAHGGTIDVRSSDENGTVFSVRLPRTFVPASITDPHLAERADHKPG